ncbi:hypothetical protein ABPG74_017601 [Tetrahymena malaccensis]
MVKYEELIEYCIQIIKTFNPVILTVDSHSEEFVAKNKKKLEDTEIVFIKQVFYGTFRYEEFLKVLTNSLFNNFPSITNRNDSTLYHIFGYLICFRLDELPFNEFKKMVFSQDAVKMNVFLQFLFDIEKVNKYVRDGWIEIYDPGYIDNQIITQNLQEKLPVVADLLAQLSQKATGKKSDLVNTIEQTLSVTDKGDDKQQKKFEPTVPQPFKLTKPKPKAIPEPIKIPKIVKANPVPQTIFQTNLNEIVDKGKQRREEIKKQKQKELEDATKNQFKFQLDNRPNKFEKIKKEVEEEKNKQLQFDNTYFRPPPTFDEAAEIKMNVAAILREDKHLQKKQDDENKRIKDLEWNMRDSAEFENWKEEQKYKEKLENIEYQQRKKIEMELARESAMKAYEEKIQQNKLTAGQMKQISKVKESERQKKIEEEVQEKQKLIDGVLATRENAGIEMQKIKEQKKVIHDESKKEREVLLQKKKEEDEIERKKKEDLIRQIREAEKQPKVRTKGYDPTETMGYGLLEEMSIVQLRERLVQVKKQREIEREQTRQENMKTKDSKLNSLQQKVEAIKQNREQLSKQKQQEREEKKKKLAEEEQKKQQIREEQLLEVHQKVVDKKRAKKKEEDRLAKEYREIQLKRMYMNANAAVVEELAWKGQQEGAEREIKYRQNQKLLDQEQVLGVKYHERKIIADNSKKLVQEKLEFIEQYDENMERANKENEVLYRQIREDRKIQHQTIRDYEIQHNKNMVERDTFKYKMSEMSLTNAKSKLEQSKNQASRDGKRTSKNQELQLPGPKYDSTNVIKESHQEDDG